MKKAYKLLIVVFKDNFSRKRENNAE